MGQLLGRLELQRGSGPGFESGILLDPPTGILESKTIVKL